MTGYRLQWMWSYIDKAMKRDEVATGKMHLALKGKGINIILQKAIRNYYEANQRTCIVHREVELSLNK